MSQVVDLSRRRSLVVLIIAICPFNPWIEAAERVSWLTGPNLRRKLDEPVDAGWSGQALRTVLGRVSQSQQVAIVLDRRVDPGQTIELSRNQTPLRSLLGELAASRGLGVSWFEPVVYLGPPATARLLRTVAEQRKDEVSKLPSAKRLEWARLRVWRWEDLATPRDLLAELAKQGDFEFDELGRVPHDLWPAADLPPLAMADRLTLLLAQFDLTFEIEAGGRRIKLTRFPESAGLERTYPGGKQPQELAGQLAAHLPDAEVRVEQGKVVVRGLVEDHERIDAGPTRPPKPPVAQEKDLKTLKVTFTVMNVPLSVVLDKLRDQLGLTIRVDADSLRRAGKSLDGLVSLKVNDASVDETLKAALSPVGLTFRRTDKVVHVSAAE